VKEQGVDVAVAHLCLGEVEDEVGPVADPEQQVEAKEEGQAERGQRMPLSIGVDRSEVFLSRPSMM
jgi:hypothetical protein